MKITALLVVLSLACASAASAAMQDPLKCRTHDKVFDLDDSDFQAMATSFQKKDGSWTATSDEAKAVFIDVSNRLGESSTFRAAVCQSRALARMLTKHDPRKAVAADVASNGPYKDYAVTYFADSELPALNSLLGLGGFYAGADWTESSLQNA